MAAKKNYNKISTENNEVVEPEVKETVAEEVKEEPVLAQPAVVVNCSKLNVRKKPDIESKVVCILNVGDEVGIIGSLDKTFYEVKLANGTEGFCMKKYIKVK